MDGAGRIAIHLPQPNGDAFLLASDDATELDEWSAVLREVPPELRRALDELASTKAELLATRRELRNQGLEMEQVEEELASRNRLVDVEVEYKEIVEEKNAQLESLMQQLREVHGERAQLAEQLEAGEGELVGFQEQLEAERAAARAAITQARREAKASERAKAEQRLASLAERSRLQATRHMVPDPAQQAAMAAIVAAFRAKKEDILTILEVGVDVKVIITPPCIFHQ